MRVVYRSGGEIAHATDVIERNVGRDERPGPVPDIRCEGDSVVYTLRISGALAQLIIRCDPDGTVRASLTTGKSP
jgi:hypothetical protein